MATRPTAETPWDDPAWREPADTAWQAKLRSMQARWRQLRLRLPPGPHSAKNPDRLVSSTLRFDAPGDANFLSAEIAAAVDRRLASGGAGLVKEDRLRRVLLSSQPMCFNLFGNFQTPGRRSALLPWVRSVNPAAAEIVRVEIEWAPPAAEHFSGGSAFDAFIEYSSVDGGLGFLGVECKYHEDLEKSDVKTVRDVYKTFTSDTLLWRPGAATRLDVPGHRQFWLNTLLAQSLARRLGYVAGQCVVTACAQDDSARVAFDAVQCELVNPPTLVWAPWEAIVNSITWDDDWQADFRERYLDFDVLDIDEPAQVPPSGA